MSDPILGLSMLGLIVAAIMMGFPTAFTLMGLGMGFGYVAFWTAGAPWYENRIFDLMVQRTFGAMNNDTLISIPLFVFMGYIIERAALVDKMFYSVQLAFRRVPASLAVTSLLVCAFWGIASGIVGAVVVLMGVIALRPMLNAGYDVRLASGVITAGGTLGILIPPSVMLIVYAAVAGQSIVKLYAAAMVPGFLLAFLYLAYILGWAMINPKVAPKLPEDQYRLKTPDWLARIESGSRRRVFGGLVLAAINPGRLRGAVRPDGVPVTLLFIWKNLAAALLPVALTAAIFGTAWWYVVIYNAPSAGPVVQELGISEPAQAAEDANASVQDEEAPNEELGTGEEGEADAEELGTVTERETPPQRAGSGTAAQELGTEFAVKAEESTVGHVPDGFYTWYWGFVAVSAVLLFIYYWRMDGEQLEILKLLEASVVPLAILTFTVLGVILLGITTATESAGVGALGALYLAAFERFRRQVVIWSVIGLAIGLALGAIRGDTTTLLVAASLGAVFVGAAVPWVTDLLRGRTMLGMLKESTFLTAKTSAMVCWLFIGSALFSAVFALHGGQGLIEKWVLSLDLNPIMFMILAQAIIFLLGWPLEWTEIIVIFVPIFIPLLAHFNVDPILFAVMVAVNLQAAFLSPPVAMSAFYLKGVAPSHVTLNQIFSGMMPYMLIVILCLVLMYIFPGMTLWLPEFLYGR